MITLPGRSKGGGGWRWRDPGNFVYATFFMLLYKTCEHFVTVRSRVSPCNARRQNRADRCDRFCLAQRRVFARWPRKVDSKRWQELLGDMIEMVLGMAYLNEGHDDVTTTLSPVIYKVNDIVKYIKDHAPYDRNSAFRAPTQIFKRFTDFSEALIVCSSVHCVDRKHACTQLRHAALLAQRLNFQYDA